MHLDPRMFAHAAQHHLGRRDKRDASNLHTALPRQ